MMKGPGLLTCNSTRSFTLRFYGLLLLCLLVGSRSVLADVARERDRPLLGVHRWDMYSGRERPRLRSLVTCPVRKASFDLPSGMTVPRSSVG